MKTGIYTVLAAAFLIMCGQAVAENGDKGYFLTLKQKGQLIGTGRMLDEQGTLYDMLICPGYTHPARYAWRNIKEGGANMAEYVESETYKDLWDDSVDAFEWAYEDCLYKFALEGSGKAWQKNFAKANNSMRKRVFGWWMAHPWAFMLSTVENVFRIPVGLCGTAIGTAGGIAIIPAGHITQPVMEAVGNGVVEGCALSTCGFVWNTVISPPMAMFGQKPARSRVDGFWVKIVTDTEANVDKIPGDEELANLVEWGKILREELGAYEQRRAIVDAEQKGKLTKLQEEIKVVGKETSVRKQKIADEERAHAKRLFSTAEHRHRTNRIKGENWSQNRVFRNQEAIRSILRKDDTLSRTDQERTIKLIEQYALPDMAQFDEPSRLDKTDPVKESIRVIKEVN
ncbi:hypothetical protein ACFL1X_09425 [Candidatus Hydrogenedentota bacterium]